MPLNMNTIGMGNSSGSSGGSGGIGSCIYTNNEYKETIVTPDNPEFSLSPDFLVEPTENYWDNHGIYTDTSHSQRYTSFQFFINHELYVLMDFLNQSYRYNGSDIDDGEISATSNRGLFKVNENGSLTQIQLPLGGSTTYNFVHYRRTGIFSDHIVFAITNNTYRIYDVRDDGDPFNFYSYDGTSFTQLGNIISMYEQASSIVDHSYYTYDEFYGFYYYKDNCYIQFKFTTSYGPNETITVELDESYQVKSAFKYGPKFSVPDGGGNAVPVLGNHHVAICGDYAYVLYYGGNPDPNDKQDEETVYRGVAKYKIESVSYPADSLTQVSNRFVFGPTTSTPQSNGVFLYPVGKDHVVTGVLYSDGVPSQQGDGSYYQKLMLLDNAYDITIDNYSGEVVETDICTSNVSSGMQSIGQFKISSSYRDTFYAWSECVAFDLDVKNRVFRWAFSTDASYICYFNQTDFSKFVLTSGDGKTSEYIQGYFQEGDTIFVDGTVDHIEGDETADPGTSKYTIQNSGTYTVKVSAAGTNNPIVIIQDKYGSYQKINITKSSDTTIHGPVLKNMKINDIVVPSNNTDYELTDESFSKRVNISMEGV